MKLLPFVFPIAMVLSACSTPEPRFDAAPAAAMEKVSSRYARIEVAAVTLPVYAESEEIHARDATGAILPVGPLWADEPGRAVTLQIARDLDAITGRLVAPEPWPFRDFPDVKVDVRLQDFYATEQGTFRIAGQVFIAPEQNGPDRSKTFEIEAAIPGAETGKNPGPAQIATARAAAVSELSLFIVRNGLR